MDEKWFKDYQDLFFVPGAALFIRDAKDTKTLDHILDLIAHVKESNTKENHDDSSCRCEKEDSSL